MKLIHGFKDCPSTGLAYTHEYTTELVQINCRECIINTIKCFNAGLDIMVGKLRGIQGVTKIRYDM